MHILDAYKLAAELQSSRKDYLGRPYIEMAARVFLGVVQLGGDRDQQIAALLHDVMNDPSVTRDELLTAGVPDRAVRLIETLSRGSETYLEYICRIKAVPGAMLVKLCELDANIAPDRLPQLDPELATKLQNRYAMTASPLAFNL